jgi:hypothetical protein
MNIWIRRTCGLVLLLVPLLFSSLAHAVPSFARQTGSDCVACHIGGYGWHLTPYGVRFKLGGYTDTDGNGTKVPLSGLLQVNRSRSNREEWGGKDYDRLDEADVFVAGRLNDHVGVYSQVQYSDTATRTTSLNQLDFRVATESRLNDKELIAGLSLNNSPGIQDPVDTLPAWGFPALALPGQGNATNAYSNGLAGRVLGLSAYGLYDQSWYGELGTYRTMSPEMQDTLGKDRSGDPGRISASTYWRLAYMKDFKTQFVSLGLLGFNLSRQPVGAASADRYRDFGMDAVYEYLGTRDHIVQLRGAYVREQRRFGTVPANGAQATGTQIERTLAATYVYAKSYGITVARTTARTNNDPVRYMNGTGDSNMNYTEVFWTPLGQESSWGAPYANMRLTAAWIKPDKFNGSSTDAFGGGFLNPSSNDLNQFHVALQVSF